MPGNSNNPNTRVGAMAPDAFTSPVEWGPEIRVDGKRPEWLAYADKIDVPSHRGDKWYSEGTGGLGVSPGGVFWGNVGKIRLPADHPHYRQPTAPAVDWSRPIEAVHPTKDTLPVSIVENDGGNMPWLLELSNGDRLWSFPNGDTGTSWRIRNVQPTTPERDPALWDRMVSLVEDVANLAGGSTYSHLQTEAWAIKAVLSPPDPDLIEARQIACENSNWPRDHEQRLSVKQGRQDHIPMVRTALAAIKRGRELAGEQA